MFSIVLTVCYFVTYKHCISDFSVLEFVAQKTAIPAENHCTGQRQTTAVLSIYIYTWRMCLWAVHIVDSVYFTLMTPRASWWCWRMVRARCSLADREPYVTTQMRKLWPHQPGSIPLYLSQASREAPQMEAKVNLAQFRSPHRNLQWWDRSKIKLWRQSSSEGQVQWRVTGVRHSMVVIRQVHFCPVFHPLTEGSHSPQSFLLFSGKKLFSFSLSYSSLCLCFLAVVCQI